MNQEAKGHITAIIPATGGSNDFSNNNNIAFCGKPLIAWSIETAIGSKFINNVYVFTNNEKIAMISQNY